MKKTSMLDLLVLVIRRDLVLAMRRRADVLTTLIFFVMVVSLFPLGVGPEMAMLRKMAAGVCGWRLCFRLCFRWAGCFPRTILTARWSR